jgi:hypothetical protein
MRALLETVVAALPMLAGAALQNKLAAIDKLGKALP